MMEFLQLEDLRAAWPYLRHGVGMALIIGAVCPLIGIYFVLRRIVFIGVAIPQVSSAGIAFAFLSQGMGWFGLLPGATPHMGVALTGSIVFTLIALLSMGLLLPRGGQAEAVIGLVFVAVSGLSLVLIANAPVAEAGLLNMLKGEIVAVTAVDLIQAVVFFGLVGGLLLVFNKDFLLLAFDRDLAVTMGKAVAAWDVFFFILAGVAVSVAVFNVGPIAGFAFLIVPPLIGLLFSRNMVMLFPLSAAVGIVGSLAGFFLAFRFDLPAGPAGAVFLGATYAVLAGVKILALRCFR